MHTAIILGAGMVGSVMALDLGRVKGEFEITIADSRADAIQRVVDRCREAGIAVRGEIADLSDAATIRRLIAPYNVVLGALASRIAFDALRTVIESGKPYADISFMGEDALELDTLARERGVTAVVDMGVAPGMSHLLAGRAAAALSVCERIEIYVGGLPVERRWPYQYRAAFSPSDVVEEYTRPTRLVEHGKVVVRPALSEPELMEFDGVGTLEAFNTDGLRSLAATHLGRVPMMKEKTLRYPGHIELMRVLRETGLFNEEPVEIATAEGGLARIRPRDLMARLLFPMWTYGPGEEDLTVMRVIGEGMKNGKRVRMQWDLFDRFDRETRCTSMARTTAFPCTIIARMLARGELSKPGVIVPEMLGANAKIVEHVLAEHAARGVEYRYSETAG
ncbi:MAG: saccharopine dehydrogenase NADP-binding domain-containing protein [Phycisphaeraceae bacterium]|nr:saccharopine dehydrogenase NADP-binding domain-containing protein [Phycisphaeraceae bacterium]